MTANERFVRAQARVKPYPAGLPISFVYGGRKYRGLEEALFHPSIRRDEIDSRMTRTAITGRLADGLEVRVECTVYRDYPAVEWYAEFTHRGAENSAILEQVRLVDEVYEGASPVLLHSNGDTVDYDGYQLLRTPVGADGIALRPLLGNPSDGAFPFMRLMTEGGGYNFAVGWPGGWLGDLDAAEGGTRVRFGQESLRAYLKPGETLRAPRVLVMAYDGDEADGRKQWRDFYRDHVLIREAGAPLGPLNVMSYGGGGVEFTKSTEENQLAAIDSFLAKGYRPDIWWIDAGWYPCNLKWEAAGTWKSNPEHYPNGLGPVGERCAREGVRFLQWFELERVTEGSELDVEHPEWMLYLTDENGKRDWTRMLNLANEDCLRWAIERVDSLICQGHVTIYRQDFNIHPPARYWATGDEPDRAGTTENHHIQNLLVFWDTLKERHPGLLIDNCSSGGRRNDYELMRRSVPLHYTDVGYGVHPEKQQQYRIMHEWIPYFRSLCMNWDKPGGTYGQWAMPDDPSYFDRFASYASLAPAIDQKVSPFVTDEEVRTTQWMLEIWRPAAELMLRGDYYPLLESKKRADAWDVRQFDDPEKGDGVIVAIRNVCSEEESVTVRPHVQPGARYELTCMDPEARRTATAEEMAAGFVLTAPKRGGVVWFYRKIEE